MGSVSDGGPGHSAPIKTRNHHSLKRSPQKPFLVCVDVWHPRAWACWTERTSCGQPGPGPRSDACPPSLKMSSFVAAVQALIARLGRVGCRPSTSCAMMEGHACGDGGPCPRLPRSVQSHDHHPVYDWWIDRPFLKIGSARHERQFVGGTRGGFRAPLADTCGCHPGCSHSHKLQGRDPPHRQQEIVRGRASPACSRRTRRRTAPGLEPP